MKYKYWLSIFVVILSGCTTNTQEVKALQDKVEQLQTKLAESESSQRQEVNAKGLSYGGVVRSAATIDSPRLLSLKAGDKLEILERVKEFRNGYHWFKIRTQTGVVGYQWGGLLCSFSPNNVGTFRSCVNF
ncbi:SH3 domain-containing protein [Marinomonas sp. TI.3.20]|uniref:SH3 domain-containing protein n=1 Tax=Marinomonas sp. TI.3.20 TaxID=3121296 RepID=UPI00311E7A98